MLCLRAWWFAAVALMIGVIAGPGPALAGPPIGVAAVYQPAPYSQMHTFWIGENGALRTVRKEHNGRWHQAFDLTPPGWGIPNSPVTAVWQVQNDQMEVFWVDGAGVLNVAWSDHGNWHTPAKISAIDYYRPGAHLAGVWHPTVHEMMIFGMDARGVLKMMWTKDNKGGWRTAADMSGPNFGAPGGAVTAVYQPWDERVQIFAVGADGRVNLVWKSRDNAWAPAAALTPPGVADPNAKLSAAWYNAPSGKSIGDLVPNVAGPLSRIGPSFGPDLGLNQIEVFWIDQKGAAHVL